MVWLLASSLPLGCVDYTLNDPDDTVVPDVELVERFTQSALPKVDVLFVVDDTGSMAEEQQALATAATTFVSALDDLDVSYQLGVVSTDPEQEGALLGRPWIITGSADDPAAALAFALAVGTDGIGPAAGFYAASLALADAHGLNRGFRRADATLQVIVLSDGDDESDAWLGDDPTAAFLDVLAADAEESGRAARLSAVVGDVPAGCSGASGSATPGTRYVAAAEASGGLVASICSADFAPIAAELGDASVEWQTRFPLQAVPNDGSVRVEVDGERLDEGWTIDASGPTLVFAVAPAPDAEIVVRYAIPGES